MSKSGGDLLRVVIEPARDGATHMRRDEELLQTMGSEPILRLYTWAPPAVSCGYMQDPATLLDLEACRERGIDVVRRPTGGRTILHWEEITYALVAATSDPRFGSDVPTSHAVIAGCLAEGLRTLGVPAQLSRPALDPERRLLRQPCFASPGRAEILVAGRKLVGSAQRRLSHAFLQHGSLLTGPAHLELVDLLLDARRDATVAAAMRERLARDTVALADLLGTPPAFEQLVDALVAGFTTTLGLRARYEGSLRV
jgi:lipoate-protein ligase A